MSRPRILLRALGAPARLVLLAGIGLYRITLSGWLGGQCRFHPTCSQYARDAIRIHGATRGSLMAIWRIARCGPFTAGGVDQVPARRSTVEMYDSVTPSGSAS